MTDYASAPKYRGCYLTIDDGPDATFEDKVAWLDAQGVKAIWYCQGSNLLEYETELVAAIKKGHLICNHSYDHPDFSDLSDEEAILQVEKTQSIIDDLYLKAGLVSPIKSFRYPYLVAGSQSFSRLLYEKGYRHPLFVGKIPSHHQNDIYLSTPSVGTNFDTEDWRVVNIEQNFDEEKCVKSLANKLVQWRQNQHSVFNDGRPYTIVLCHCFTKTPLFIEMVKMMLKAGMVFQLPSSSRESHLLPIERQDDHHMIKHQRIMSHKDRDEVELVLIGDSITRRWEDQEKANNANLGNLKSINMGVGGDTINNLMWRIKAGELDGLKPTYISLLIGTNSLPIYPDQAVIEGLKKVIVLILRKCPDAKLIYNHIFPRNPDDACTDYLSRIRYINQIISEWLPTNIIQLSMMDVLLEGNKLVDQRLMPDGLHMNEVGYHKWGKALSKLLI